MASETRTVVIYESPYRLSRTLSDLLSVLGGSRKVVVARELTKLHEEVVKGTLEEVSERFSVRTAKGEIVILVGEKDKEKGHQESKDDAPVSLVMT